MNARRMRSTAPDRAAAHEARWSKRGSTMAQTVPMDATGFGPPPPKKITYEQFLQELDEQVHAEWVDGEVVLMSPIGAEHQEIGRFLLIIVSLYVEDRR